jgi:hypothetical protein
MLLRRRNAFAARNMESIVAPGSDIVSVNDMVIESEGMTWISGLF